ncbi:zeta toxin family protein [Streptomyces sp. NPDC097610]|uniref:zeta toxin family protein n=1 Tax=Streptomyces sp. NPDC097610 TaxID=3157227 RepID=UPI003318CF72
MACLAAAHVRRPRPSHHLGTGELPRRRRTPPILTSQAVHQQRPVVVAVAGQPGARKTTLADLIAAVLDRRGGAVRVGRDLYKSLHRHYAKCSGRRRPYGRSPGPSRHRALAGRRRSPRPRDGL